MAIYEIPGLASNSAIFVVLLLFILHNPDACALVMSCEIFVPVVNIDDFCIQYMFLIFCFVFLPKDYKLKIEIFLHPKQIYKRNCFSFPFVFKNFL